MSRESWPPTRGEIHEAFGVDVGELHRHGDGWESTGWTDGVWFVKVWHRAPPMNLAALAQFSLPVPVPVALPAIDGERSATTGDGRSYGIFPLFRGRHATPDDWHETARVLRAVHDHPLLSVKPISMSEPSIQVLRDLLDHQWVSDRRAEVEQYVGRLESLVERAAPSMQSCVVLHTDFGGSNLLIDHAGKAIAVLDWDEVCVGPREHDVWIAFEHPDATAFLTAYGARGLDATQLEYALLRRAVQDLTARLVANTDRAGVETWGFDRWRRLDADLERAAPFL